MPKLRVAIIVPSLRILVGQAGHSQRLIDGIEPAGLRAALELK